MWKFRIEYFLEAKGLTEFVNGVSVEPEQEKQPEQRKKWKQRSAQAAVILLGSIERAVRGHLINWRGPAMIWNKIFIQWR